MNWSYTWFKIAPGFSATKMMVCCEEEKVDRSKALVSDVGGNHLGCWPRTGSLGSSKM